MSGVMMGVAGGAANLTASLVANLSNVSLATGSYTVSVTLNADGTVTKSGAGTGSTVWVSPAYSGVGAQVWVQAGTPTGGGSWSFTAGAWNSLTSGLTLSIHNTSTTLEYTGSIALSFAMDSGGATVIGSGTFNYDVGKTS